MFIKWNLRKSFIKTKSEFSNLVKNERRFCNYPLKKKSLVTHLVISTFEKQKGINMLGNYQIIISIENDSHWYFPFCCWVEVVPLFAQIFLHWVSSCLMWMQLCLYELGCFGIRPILRDDEGWVVWAWSKRVKGELTPLVVELCSLLVVAKLGFTTHTIESNCKFAWS